MQYINHWPDATKLALSEAVAKELYRQLLEPFDSEREAKEFWNETSSTIIILDPNDSIKHLQQTDAWNQIEFTLTYPEYTLPLSMDYQLLVAIINDSGAGNFLVIPPNLSHILTEVDTHE